MNRLASLISLPYIWRYQSVPSNEDISDDDSRLMTASEKQEAICPTSDFLSKRAKPERRLFCWAVNIVFLCANSIMLVVLLFFSKNQNTFTAGPIVQPLSHAIFGHIPVRKVTWLPDVSFTSTDPWNGAFWNNGSGPKGTTPWDDLFRSGWIAVDDPKVYGLSGGVPLREFAAPKFADVWSESAEGYNPTVIHQIHCVGILKHLIEAQVSHSDEQQGSNQAYGRLSALFEHGQHCIEYLRQSTMCAADLTLEPPQTVDLAGKMIHGTTGWGTTHFCRDWNVVHDRIWEKLIKIYHVGEQGMMAVAPDNM